MNRDEQIKTIEALMDHASMACEAHEWKKDWKALNEETLTVMIFMLTWVDERLMR